MDNIESVPDQTLLLKVLEEKENLARERQDSLHQQLYDVKRSAVGCKNMEEECNDEWEELESEANSLETKQDLLKITKQNEVIAPLKHKLSLLDEDYSQYEESSSNELKSLMEKIAVLRKKNHNSDNGNTPHYTKPNKEQLLNGIQGLKEEIMLKQQVSSDQIVEIDNLNEKMQQISVILEEYQQIIKSDKEESQRINEELTEVKDEIVLLESQVSMMNLKPLDEKARGNGLFGEINERGSLMKEKLKQLIKAYNENMVLVARSMSQLKKLRIDSITKMEEKKHFEDALLKEEECDLISEIEGMETEIECLEEKICDMPYVVDPDETEANARYIKHLIDKPSQLARDKRKEALQSAKNVFEMGKEVNLTLIELIKLRHSLTLEEAKHAKMVELIKYNKDSESKLEESEETITDGSNDDSSIILESSNAKHSAQIISNVENTKPEKEKKKPQLKFVNIMKKINLDDL